MENLKELLMRMDNVMRPSHSKRKSCDSDVSIVIVYDKAKTGERMPNIYVTFRNHVSELFSESDFRVSCVFAFDRLFFVPDKAGYKVTGKPNIEGSGYLKCRIYGSNIEKTKNMVGDYELKEQDGVYYVEKEETR